MHIRLDLCVIVIMVAICAIPDNWLSAEQDSTKRVVLFEGKDWDIDADEVNHMEGGDLVWARAEASETAEPSLDTANGARLRVLKTRKYESISIDHLSRIDYSLPTVSGSDLPMGAVLALQTSAGNFAKLRVIRHNAKSVEFNYVLYEAPYQTTVLLGTWQWDMETDRMAVPGVDVSWEQFNAELAKLTPRNGAAVRIVEKEFSTLSLSDLARLEFPKTGISKAQLTPGTVVAIRTSSGKFGKMRVQKYRALHDFSFPEARYLTPRWRQFVVNKPNEDSYHLEIQWVLFDGKSVKVE